jgi:predicted nucleotidyltransferase
LLDFSNRTELAFLADLASAFGRAAGSQPYYLAGATARDLLLEHAHGINPGRDTRDLDLAVMVADWTGFEQLRQALLESEHFSPIGDLLQKLRFKDVYELDLIPFGAIEQDDRTIAWPPDGEMVMGVFGFREVYDSTLLVQLPGGEAMRVVSLAALAFLKLVAWEERRWRRPGTDAHDVSVILQHYLDADNLKRLYTEAEHLLDAPDFDYEAAGAWLLCQDMARLLPASGHSRLSELFHRETDVEGQLNLVGDLSIEADRGLMLLQEVAQGFQETSRLISWKTTGSTGTSSRAIKSLKPRP